MSWKRLGPLKGLAEGPKPSFGKLLSPTTQIQTTRTATQDRDRVLKAVFFGFYPASHIHENAPMSVPIQSTIPKLSVSQDLP